jgi:hypothetical protein
MDYMSTNARCEASSLAELTERAERTLFGQAARVSPDNVERKLISEIPESIDMLYWSEAVDEVLRIS